MLTAFERTAAIALAGLLVGVIVSWSPPRAASASSSLRTTTPSRSSRRSPDGEITQEEFDLSIEQAAARPADGGAGSRDAAVRRPLEPAMADLLLGRWVAGEADERGIEVTGPRDRPELETIIEDQFGGQNSSTSSSSSPGSRDEDARSRSTFSSSRSGSRIRSSRRIPRRRCRPPSARAARRRVVPDDEIQDFYDENIAQFESPEARDVRTLLNPDQEKAQEAFDQLAEDDSAASVEARHQGAFDRRGDRPASAACARASLRARTSRSSTTPSSRAEGELVGPIETEAGFYVLQVDSINEASTQPLDEETAARSASSSSRRSSSRPSPTSRTSSSPSGERAPSARRTCSPTTRTARSRVQLAERCSNFEVTDDGCVGDDESDELQPDPVTGEVPEEPDGCAAFVPLRPVIPPIPLPQDAADPLAAAAGARRRLCRRARSHRPRTRQRCRPEQSSSASRVHPPGPSRPAPRLPAPRLPARHRPARRLPRRARRRQRSPQVEHERRHAAAQARLDEITRRLRVECPWDREQDERSIVPHTVEEAYELADAAAQGDDAKMLDELGDVLFQVHFLSLLLEERGAGSLAAVAEGITDKLIRRHPHVFGEAEADDVRAKSSRTGTRSSAKSRVAARTTPSRTCRRTSRASVRAEDPEASRAGRGLAASEGSGGARPGRAMARRHPARARPHLPPAGRRPRARGESCRGPRPRRSAGSGGLESEPVPAAHPASRGVFSDGRDRTHQSARRSSTPGAIPRSRST